MGNAVYNIIQERVLGMLNNGIIPWNCPYKIKNKFGGFYAARSHSTKRPYSFMNQMLLGFRAGEYWTRKQIDDAGYRIRKGAEAYQIYFWKMIQATSDEDGKPIQGTPKTIPFLRYYTVFHEDDVEGLVKTENNSKVEISNPAELRESVVDADDMIFDYFCAEEPLRLVFNSHECPCYKPKLDIVSMPPSTAFDSMGEYYASLFHEMVHSTGAKCRLDRLAEDWHNVKDYSREEMVAEIGAAALLDVYGMKNDALIQNSTAYIVHWLDVLKRDIKPFVWACARAEKAVAFILGEIDDDE